MKKMLPKKMKALDMERRGRKDRNCRGRGKKANFVAPFLIWRGCRQAAMKGKNPEKTQHQSLD